MSQCRVEEQRFHSWRAARCIPALSLPQLASAFYYLSPSPAPPTFLLSDLLHPLQLAQFVQFIVERDPRTGHFRVDLAESTFADASAGAMAHEFWALGLERAIRNWWSLVHPSRMLLAMFFSRDQYSYRHRRSVDRNALSNNVYPLLG